jgi:hypothetical protein
MRVVSRQALRRWVIVAAGAALLCGLPAVVANWPVPASTITAAQLRARIIASPDVSFQGYADSDVDLNLPSLPNLVGVTGLLDGTTEQYVWYRSPAQWRADVLTAAGENDIYQTSAGTFQWDYASNVLTQVIGNQPVRLPRASDLLPPALGVRLLALAGRADHFSRLPSRRVGGVDAAGLRIVPAESGTTISAVEIWADPANGLPVLVELFGVGSAAPVLTTRFVDLSLTRPALSDVTPDPGPGVDESVASLPDAAGILNGYGPILPSELGRVRATASPPGLSDVAVYGTGFARFAVVPLPIRAGNEVIDAASSAGASIPMRGGTAVLVRTPLLTMVLVRSTDGPVYMLTGAVTAEVLERACANLLAEEGF